MVKKGITVARNIMHSGVLSESGMGNGKWELAITFLVPLIFYFLASLLDYRRSMQIDQTTIALLVMVICLFWYISRRTQELQSEMLLRKAIEENLYISEERYRSLFERSIECVYIHDLAGNYVDANDVGLEVLGYSRNGISNLRYDELIAKEQIDVARQIFSNVKEKGYQDTTELMMRCKDGRFVHMEVQASLINQHGEPYAVQTIGRDITARKQMQEQLEMYSKELEEQFEALQAAYNKLKELDEMKDRLLSTVSHEMRTPLASIKSFTEILLNYDNDRDTEREFLGIINNSSDRLGRLINDFLDLSKIESGRTRWMDADVHVGEIIDRVAIANRAILDGMNLKLDVKLEPDLPSIRFDPDRLMQLIDNLVSNAIKFTPNGGSIWVKAENLQRNGSPMVKISVADSGIGIAPNDQRSIFDKFVQIGDTLTGKPDGSGLGLSICQHIVEHYGGIIWVDSAPGKGSTFSFTVPPAEEDVIETMGSKAQEVMRT